MSSNNASSVLIGSSDEVPKLKIYINEDNSNNTLYARIDPNTKQTVTGINAWDPKWDRLKFMLEPTDQNVSDFRVHYDVVTLGNSDGSKKEIQFAFEIDYSCNDDINNDISKSVMMSIYSPQNKELVHNGYAIKRGRISRLQRYRDRDQAFCITPISKIDNSMLYTSAKQVFEKSVDDDNVCSLIVMVAPGNAYPYFSSDVQVDGISFKPKAEENGIYNAKLSRGGKTNQSFNWCRFEYDGNTIDIYNIVLLYGSGMDKK